MIILPEVMVTNNRSSHSYWRHCTAKWERRVRDDCRLCKTWSVGFFRVAVQFNYPVGASGKGHKAATKGSKYNISPVRRSLLSGVTKNWKVKLSRGCRENGIAAMACRFLGIIIFSPTGWNRWIEPNLPDGMNRSLRDRRKASGKILPD